MRFQNVSFSELRDLSESMAAVAAAATAGIFTALDRGPRSPEALARHLGLNPRSLTILLPFLEELALVESQGGEYHLTARAQRELADPASPDYAAGGLPLWLLHLRGWTRLPEVLETGEPLEPDEEPGDDPESGRKRLGRFMAGMAAAPEERVRTLVDGVLARRPGARTLLDLGGGPGHIARAFVARGLDVTLLDRPDVIAFVREAYGLAGVDGLRTEGADFFEDPLPDGPFDVVLLSNILHLLSPDRARRLLGRTRSVVAPGAVVAVADFIRGISPRATRFAAAMLLRTRGGNTYSLEDHREWFREAGYDRVRVAPLDGERQLVTAVARDE